MTIFITPGGSSSPLLSLFILSSKTTLMRSICSLRAVRHSPTSASAFSSAGIISCHFDCGMVSRTSAVMGLPLLRRVLPFLSAIRTADFLLRRSFLTLE